ncbi:FAS1 domain-containing protein [Phaeosphaeriaceae sp. PMI808]|nr:FAS1 domain-containing protein [Phaeosphaeriaceae sp. PMI808]
MKLQTALLLGLPTISASTTLKSLISSHPKLSILYGLLQQFDLIEKLNDLDNITVIAPTNQAYIDLANWGFNLSEAPAPMARAVLRYHVLEGDYASETINKYPRIVHTYLKPPILTNVTQGATVKLRKDNGGKVITHSGLNVAGSVEEEDMQFNGGVLHTLNSSMVLPHNITLTAEFLGLTRFLTLLEKAGLVEEFETLKDITVFIPHNDALKNTFGLLSLLTQTELANVLRSHVIPNEVVYGETMGEGGKYKSLSGRKLLIEQGRDKGIIVNGVKVIKEDICLYAGVAHVIDNVLILDADEKSKVRSHFFEDKAYIRQDLQLPFL